MVADAMMRDLWRLFTPTNLSGEEESVLVAAMEQVIYPMERVVRRVMRDPDETVFVTMDPDMNMGAKGLFHHHLTIMLRPVEFKTIGGGKDSRDVFAMTFLHEVGHLVDAATLTNPIRRELSDLWHTDEATKTWRYGNNGHDDIDHRNSLSRRGWSDKNDVWSLRLVESFAEQWVCFYARPVWDAARHERRSMHWTEDFDAFHDIIMERDMSLPTERIAGDTRYDTALAISRHRFPEGADVVYVATGDDWPDTISAAALVTDGPLLLVPEGDIPQQIHDEIARISPLRIVAIGGEAAVPKDTLDALAAV